MKTITLNGDTTKRESVYNNLYTAMAGIDGITRESVESG